MNKEKYISDLSDIKEMMNRSSRFISLSGLSGVFAGAFALIAVFLVYNKVYADQDYSNYISAGLASESLAYLLIVATVTLLASIGTCVYLTTKETKKRNQSIWDAQVKRLIVNLAIPLITGGLIILILLLKGFIGIAAPLTLIFYGLALVNASKYTLSEIRSLGLIEIGLGLLGVQFIGYGLLFWAVGFGVMHIVYGMMMHVKYKS
jgi:hypothetical protein